MSKTVLVTVLPLLGVVVGAGLQYLFTRLAEARRHLRDLRTEAYIDYLRCISESPRLRKQDRKERITLLNRTVAAKARICIYGSSDVVKSLSKFEEGGAQIDTPEKAAVFLAVVKQMRSESGVDEADVGARNLELLLLGPGWSSRGEQTTAQEQ